MTRGDLGVDRKVLVAGGSGFVGKSLRLYLRELGADFVTVAGRHCPALYSGERFIEWDLVDTERYLSDFDVLFHFAEEARHPRSRKDEKKLFQRAVSGTKSVLSACGRMSRPPVLVFASSGSVYGALGDEMAPWTESSPTCIAARNSYAHGKQVSESLILEAGRCGVCIPVIARLFSFSGRFLPLDRHFAIGNFVRDAAGGGPIVVKGDGSVVRSYLDGSDMAEWLWQSFLQVDKITGPIVIGSEREINLSDLAGVVAERSARLMRKRVNIEIEGRSDVAGVARRYSVDPTFTKRLLGVQETVSLEVSVDRMLRDAVGG